MNEQEHSTHHTYDERKADIEIAVQKKNGIKFIDTH